MTNLSFKYSEKLINFIKSFDYSLRKWNGADKAWSVDDTILEEVMTYAKEKDIEVTAIDLVETQKLAATEKAEKEDLLTVIKEACQALDENKGFKYFKPMVELLLTSNNIICDSGCDLSMAKCIEFDENKKIDILTLRHVAGTLYRFIENLKNFETITK